ncbi:MAG: DUF2190 family protein [Planctomycetaceae bacterium]|jgi:predicted RecA/RadA family phage recombinase|nr:DUF2190 family protein [Planctomycetaceae bacterium]
MQARFIHDGNAIDFFPETDVSAGSVIAFDKLVGIAKLDIPAGHVGALAVVGIYDIQKGNVAIPLGSRIYWDAAAKQAVLDAANNTPLGIAVLEAKPEDATVRARINHA